MLGALFCGCRAGHLERESGLINNHTYPRSPPLSLSFRSSRLFALISAPFLSLSRFFPSPSHIPRLLCRFPTSLSPPPSFFFPLPSFFPFPLRLICSSNRVRAKIKSELICHERAPFLSIDGLDNTWLYLNDSNVGNFIIRNYVTGGGGGESKEKFQFLTYTDHKEYQNISQKKIYLHSTRAQKKRKEREKERNFICKN